MLRVIVVDDEIEARDKMIRSINKGETGISIIGAAADGESAYRLIMEKRPDLVLIDIDMPRMSGLEVIKKVNESGAVTVFIIVSSYSDFYYAQEAISLGVNDYLLKPFLPSEICASIFRAAKHLRMLKLLPYLEEMDDRSQTLFSSANVALEYPYEMEKQLIISIISGDEEQLRRNLAEFFRQTKEKHTSRVSANRCYTALYIELQRTAQEHNITLDEFNAKLAHLSVTDEQMLQNVLMELCLQLSAKVNQRNVSASVVLRAKEYIENHYTEALTLSAVAEQVFVSPNYLSGLFMRYLNMHFIDYIQYVRICKAQELIRERCHLKNYEISELVGFNSVKYLCVVFKKVTGMSISQYRTQLNMESLPSDGNPSAGR